LYFVPYPLKQNTTIKEQFNHLRHLKLLYEDKLGVFAQLAQFLFVGMTGMFVDLITFALLLHVLHPYLGRALAIWVAMTWNYWLNRKLTFSHARSRPIMHQYILFCLSCTLGAVVSWSVFVGLHSAIVFFAERPLVAAFVGILAGTALNFLMSKYIAFK
jgi:dolichol-phosphate mannosyltransferase